MDTPKWAFLLVQLLLLAPVMLVIVLASPVLVGSLFSSDLRTFTLALLRELGGWMHHLEGDGRPDSAGEGGERIG
ncbi:hypothetical protein [Streptomyces sp. SM1]|uniref:hypothetical protein n=1 Tax=Streptomyces sp. SM1 TaxID=402229 RepID=UPI000CD52B9C|nr:hypothetical protein [Streptomyces sp. SM1]